MRADRGGVAGGLTIDPAHPKVIYAGVPTDAECTRVDMWRIQVR